MIEKIIKLNDVAKLKNATPRGAISLGKVNIIYADNAMGKTTFCEVLRSLVKGDNEWLLRRQTRSSTDKPKVSLLIAGKNYSFEDSSWSELFSDIEIFDPTFIDKNVYSGNEIKHDHKRNLSYFIFGEEGVTLAKEVDKINKEIREINQEIAEKEKVIRAHIVGEYTLENFLKLSEIDNIETEIENQVKKIDSLRKANEILERLPLSSFQMLNISVESLENILAESFDTVSKDVETEIEKHIGAFTPHIEQKWLERGLEYKENTVCPFCGLNIEGNQLIEAYKAFFGEAYKRLKERVLEHYEQLKSNLSEAKLRQIQSTILLNDTGVEFWKQHIRGEFPTMSKDYLGEKWLQVWESLQLVFDKKLSALLDEVKLSDELRKAIDDYHEVKEKTNEYLDAVDEINKLVLDKKESMRVEDLIQEQRELTRLQNAQLKSKSFMVELIEEYNSLTEKKAKLEEQKDEAKVKLDTYKEEIMPRYQNSVNDVLANSGAGFRIANAKDTYIGGGPRSEYQLVIDGVRSEMEDVCFLSEGDKRTLAFAFFLSRLEEDPDLATKVVVLDDPITSFDNSRRHYTKQQVLNLKGRAGQVVVLTHDASFALMLWKALPDVRVLQIRREGDYGVFDEWDIERETRNEYLQDYFRLLDYIEVGAVGDLLKIASRIRPLLEGNLRLRFPKSFRQKEWLGDFLGRIRDAGSNDVLYNLKPIYDELSEINEFCKRFHHFDPSQVDTNVKDSELRPYVERTLTIVRGT